MEEGRGHEVLKSKSSSPSPGSRGLSVQRTHGPRVLQDISESYSNSSLTLKKVHLVNYLIRLSREPYFTQHVSDAIVLQQNLDNQGK